MEARKKPKRFAQDHSHDTGGQNDAASPNLELFNDDRSNEQSDDASSPNPAKRKRDTAQVSELEIDVDLPEPPSKKALRKAKRQKSVTAGAEPTQAQQSQSIVKQGAKSTLDRPSSTIEEQSKDTGETASVPKKDHSAYGIWIGNLPFAVTKASLRSFFTTNAPHESPIPEESITRVHMPAPTNAAATKTTIKPTNKGFAYVDFSTANVHAAALTLSETSLGGRRVLIKDAKNFSGRPVKEAAPGGGGALAKSSKRERSESKRVFVGNLGFDVTREDLEKHFGQCDGHVEDVHMATFEDSGKCKGFAWVTFDRVEAAADAVRGFTYLPIDDDAEDAATEGNDKSKKKGKKWFVNRLQGRQLRCEFAEDPSLRYKKRFRKDTRTGGDRENDGDGDSFANVEDPKKTRLASIAVDGSGATGITPGAPTDRSKRRGKGLSNGSEKPLESSRKGDQEGWANYRTGAMAEAQGKKITFD